MTVIDWVLDGGVVSPRLTFSKSATGEANAGSIEGADREAVGTYRISWVEPGSNAFTAEACTSMFVSVRPADVSTK